MIICYVEIRGGYLWSTLSEIQYLNFWSAWSGITGIAKRLRGLSPSCAFDVFALPFRDIYAVMMMREARQSEGEWLKFEA